MERFEKALRNFWTQQRVKGNTYPFLEAVGRELKVRNNQTLRRLNGKQRLRGDR